MRISSTVNSLPNFEVRTTYLIENNKRSLQNTFTYCEFKWNWQILQGASVPHVRTITMFGTSLCNKLPPIFTTSIIKTDLLSSQEELFVWQNLRLSERKLYDTIFFHKSLDHF